jgi:CheY-like chemotaxis protein
VARNTTNTQRGKENKARILLADDNLDMRDYVARLLCPKYQVICASNGASCLLEYHYHIIAVCRECDLWSVPLPAGIEVLSMLESSKEFDMVLTDVMMPYLDGFGLLKEIRYSTDSPNR